MKKQKLLLLIGGLLIMIMMTACKDSKIPENRTKEEYQAEQNFKPFFEFLAQKDKDLSKIQKYLLLVSDSGDALDLEYFYSIQDLKKNKDLGKFETRKSQIEKPGGYNELENKEVPFEYFKNNIVYPKGKKEQLKINYGIIFGLVMLSPVFLVGSIENIFGLIGGVLFTATFPALIVDSLYAAYYIHKHPEYE